MQQFALISLWALQMAFLLKRGRCASLKATDWCTPTFWLSLKSRATWAVWRKRKIVFVAHSFFLFLSFTTTHGAEVRWALWKKALWAIRFFYSFLYVFTNLLLIWSRASLGLSDIWVSPPPRCFFFLFCFVLVLCVCVADFQFVKSILRAVVSTFVLWFLDIVI